MAGVSGSATRPAAAELAGLLRQVRRIELRTRRLVDSRFAGDYHSVFKGQGIEFAEVREYEPGDEVRAIDWNVTARRGHPYVKRYVEERELSVLLLVDVSASLAWGTRRRLKSELVAELAAALAMSAVHNQDRVGLLLVSDRVERFLPPRKGRRNALRLVRELLAFQPESRGTDLAAGLAYAARVLRGRSVIFVCSDFRLGDGWPAAERALAPVALQHDVIAVRLADPADPELPGAGLLRLTDPESGRGLPVNTSAAAVRAAYRDRVALDRERGARVFRRLRIDEVRVSTAEPYERALLGFFRRRERRVRR